MNKNVITLLCLSLLTACGGGGGSGNPAPTTSIPASSIQSSVALSSSSAISSAAPSSIPASSSSVPASSSSESSSSVSLSPLPIGSGTLSTRFVLGGTYAINETTGTVTLQENSLDRNYRAADIDPNGYVIAISLVDTSVNKIDLIAGTAETLFSAPEILAAIAVAPDGTIVGVSQEEEFGKKFIYRFSASGEQLSKTVSDDFNPAGIDFDKDGALYGVDLMGTWVIDPVTGQSTSKYLLSPSGQNDIDIDADGNLRIISFGNLLIYSISTGAKLSETTLQHDYFSFSPLVRR